MKDTDETSISQLVKLFGFYKRIQKTQQKLKEGHSYSLIIKADKYENFKKVAHTADSEKRPLPEYKLTIRKAFEDINSEDERKKRKKIKKEIEVKGVVGDQPIKGQ